ncbi:MAG: alpha/beta hydrolase [Pseudomonadota bacterium]
MKDPLVLLPGMMCDARVFGPQIAALSVEYAVTIAPVTGGDRMEEIASGLLDVLPRKFAVAGLAMGGMVAMELLRRAPDRVSRIALISTTSLPETPQSAADYEPLITKLKAGLLDQAVGNLVRPEHLAPGPGRNSVLNLLASMADKLGAEAMLSQARALQRRRDYQSTLRQCHVPTLVVCGESDTLTPVKRHEFMASLMPQAELALIQEAGHYPTLEAPDAVIAAFRTWMRQPMLLNRKMLA